MFSDLHGYRHFSFSCIYHSKMIVVITMWRKTATEFKTRYILFDLNNLDDESSQTRAAVTATCIVLIKYKYKLPEAKVRHFQIYMREVVSAGCQFPPILEYVLLKIYENVSSIANLWLCFAQIFSHAQHPLNQNSNLAYLLQNIVN